MKKHNQYNQFFLSQNTKTPNMNTQQQQQQQTSVKKFQMYDNKLGQPIQPSDKTTTNCKNFNPPAKQTTTRQHIQHPNKMQQ